jgi:uncharacterized protein YndB with AHSA1/START domain
MYVTYIRTTPEKVWRALTVGRVTREYWGMENVSDWKRGSPWRHVDGTKGRRVRLVGKVLESKPPRRLVLTWAFPDDAGDRRNTSRVAFDIAKLKNMVRLTVTHENLRPGSGMDRGIREGWPRVLSSLKSFLETARPLNTWQGKR